MFWGSIAHPSTRVQPDASPDFSVLPASPLHQQQQAVVQTPPAAQPAPAPQLIPRQPAGGPAVAAVVDKRQHVADRSRLAGAYKTTVMRYDAKMLWASTTPFLHCKSLNYVLCPSRCGTPRTASLLLVYHQLRHCTELGTVIVHVQPTTGCCRQELRLLMPERHTRPRPSSLSAPDRSSYVSCSRHCCPRLRHLPFTSLRPRLSSIRVLVCIDAAPIVGNKLDACSVDASLSD